MIDMYINYLAKLGNTKFQNKTKHMIDRTSSMSLFEASILMPQTYNLSCTPTKRT